MNPNASSQIRDYTGATTVNAGTLAMAFGLVDADDDGTASCREVMDYDNAPGPFSATIHVCCDVSANS